MPINMTNPMDLTNNDANKETFLETNDANKFPLEIPKELKCVMCMKK